MPLFTFPIAFSEQDSSQVRGRLDLEEPLPFSLKQQGSGFYRPGRISLEGGAGLDLILYHTPSTSEFIYLSDSAVELNQLELAGLSREDVADLSRIRLPGQLRLGARRSEIIGQAVSDIAGSPLMAAAIALRSQHSLAVFPIAREGLKYQVAEALYENYGFYCDEVILDAHHVFDSTVPVYKRKVEMTLFKDKDLDRQQRDIVTLAFIADSIASGLVMKEVIQRVKERFSCVQQVEVIAPLATIRGLCRIARSELLGETRVRVHIFETLLNALPPDYYYSAHFDVPELHICPELEREYRAWWGRDEKGNFIADTACAGYGWSEVFFSPRKQIKMINEQLAARHKLTIAEIIRHNLKG